MIAYQGQHTARCCASCVRDDDGTLVLVEHDGRDVLMCWGCREGPVSMFFCADSPVGDFFPNPRHGHKRGGAPGRGR